MCKKTTKIIENRGATTEMNTKICHKHMNITKSNESVKKLQILTNCTPRIAISQKKIFSIPNIVFRPIHSSKINLIKIKILSNKFLAFDGRNRAQEILGILGRLQFSRFLMHSKCNFTDFLCVSDYLERFTSFLGCKEQSKEIGKHGESVLASKKRDVSLNSWLRSTRYIYDSSSTTLSHL